MSNVKSTPVILLEFNELSPTLIDRWIASGDLPNFKRLRDTSTVCVTEADEKQPPNLEPWIQWYSLHTGMPFREHHVFRLSEGARMPHVSVWDQLLSNGKRVMNFSSMNCRGFAKEGSVFLPDPWCDSEKAYPQPLDEFRRFYQKVTQEQTHARWSAGELASVAMLLLRSGLSAGTIWAAARQLVNERLSKLPLQWRRVQILDRILLDVFTHYYLRERPSFATFFSNSTAHLQHAYWRYLEPEKFGTRQTPENQAAYGNAVKFGYMAMDGTVGHMLDLAQRTGASLMFASALSQQAYTAYEDRGGRHYYRPNDVATLLAALGVSYAEMQPVMAHQYILSFANAEQCEAARQRIESARVLGKQLFDSAPGNEPNRLVFGAQIYAQLPADQRIEFADGPRPASDRFFDHFYQLESTKSGWHHPDGCFWFQTGTHRAMPSKVSILDVAPTILRHFDVPPAGSMAGRPLQAA
ncbi:MAG: hypothetical protein HY855_07900 [Burkholderiales bacterium]|nr:hypothetical protein [Burkholderiales bacterium]